MKRTFALCILALAGCSSTPAEHDYQVRLLGAQPGSFTSVLVDVLDLTVQTAGKSLTVQPGQRNIDLARVDQAWLLGTFRAPDGDQPFHVSLQLDDYGGFESPSEAGDIDARYGRIGFDAPRSFLAGHSTATIELDLSRSLAERVAGERILVPQVRVLY
jgi:hypothetical protein